MSPITYNKETIEFTKSYKIQTCPVVKMNGWWWKKYFSYYQKLDKIMNGIVMKNWMDHGFDEYRRALFILGAENLSQEQRDKIKRIVCL